MSDEPNMDELNIDELRFGMRMYFVLRICLIIIGFVVIGMMIYAGATAFSLLISVPIFGASWFAVRYFKNAVNNASDFCESELAQHLGEFDGETSVEELTEAPAKLKSRKMTPKLIAIVAALMMLVGLFWYGIGRFGAYMAGLF